MPKASRGGFATANFPWTGRGNNNNERELEPHLCRARLTALRIQRAQPVETAQHRLDVDGEERLLEKLGTLRACALHDRVMRCGRHQHERHVPLCTPELGDRYQ